MTSDQAVKNEARRLLSNMSSMPGYYGQTTVKVVDYFMENWSMTVFCHGQLRNIIFTPVTPNNYCFKTEAA